MKTLENNFSKHLFSIILALTLVYILQVFVPSIILSLSSILLPKYYGIMNYAFIFFSLPLVLFIVYLGRKYFLIIYKKKLSWHKCISIYILSQVFFLFSLAYFAFAQLDSAYFIRGQVNYIPNLIIFLAQISLIPIAEEILFRGILIGVFLQAQDRYNIYKKKSNDLIISIGIVVTCAFFTYVHHLSNTIEIVTIFILSLILSYMRMLGISLWVIILLHSFYNWFTLLNIYVLHYF